MASRRHGAKRGTPPRFSREQILNSPSRKIGVSKELESRLRQYMVSVMSDVVKMLRLDRAILVSASILLHTFYMVFPISPIYDKYHVIAACICLAGKLEEQRCTVQHVAEVIFYIRNKVKPSRNSPQLTEFQDRTLCSEILLLQAIGFNLCPQSPHQHIEKIARCVTCSVDQIKNIVDFAGRFVNDSLKTPVCTVESSETIAIACVHMAIIWMNMSLPPNERLSIDSRWYMNHFRDVEPFAIEFVCQLVLDVLEHPLSSQRPSSKSHHPRQSVSSLSPTRRKPSPS